MCTLFSASQRRLFTIINYKLNLFRCTIEKRQYPLNGLLAVQFHTTGVTLYSDTLPIISHKMNSDIHILTKDSVLRVHSGPFDRAYICQKYGLEPRHLQKMDSDLLINVPEIDICAGKFICIALRTHRCILKHDQCIFFIPLAKIKLPESFENKNMHLWEKIVQAFKQRVQYIHKQYNQRMNTKMQSDLSLNSMTKTSFEFEMIEIILDSVVNSFKSITRELKKNYEDVQEKAFTRITIDNLRELALLKVKVDKHRRNANLTYKAITDLLARDKCLVGMYLNDNHKREISDHNEAELILEACAKQMSQVCRTIYDFEDSLQTFETTIGFILDTVRNDLLAFETRINVVSMAFGIGGFIVGVYGMNLLSGYEKNPAAFYVVISCSMSFIVGIITVGMTRLLKYRRIRLHRAVKSA